MAKSLIFRSVITCPMCGHQKEEEMPEYAIQEIYNCEVCKTVMKTGRLAHCIFCEYGSVPCPSLQRKQARE